TVADLELSAGSAQDGLKPWEHQVASVVDDVLNGGSERLSRFRDRIADERESMAPKFEAFKDAVAGEVGVRSWFRSAGAIPLVLATAIFGIAGALLVYFAVREWRPVYPRYSDVLLVGVGACLVANAAFCLGTLIFNRRAWRRRSRGAQEEAQRWDAF